MRKKIGTFIGIVLLLVLIAAVLYLTLYRKHGSGTVQIQKYTESARKLENPNRGFYQMYGFVISDEGEDYAASVADRITDDSDMTLALVQINLREYADGAITDAGLTHIDELFQALRQTERQYIIRFLYDWHGKNMEVEPENAEIILAHMSQLTDILHQYHEIIFVQQGLFIGNWGEMHGTRHLAHIKALAEQLAQSSHPDTFLAVRMPMHWRQITGIEEPVTETLAESSLACRLSLYNDGMMGSESDYGTYGEKSRQETDGTGMWNRAEELAFQEVLCRSVPNGGEVIVDNPVNDFRSAVDNLAMMHVSYLNWDYDRAVLEKWSRSTVVEDGCFDGMDGLSYIERHLGYRILIRNTALSYDAWEDTLSVEIELQNVGFAPVYKKASMGLLVCDASGKVVSHQEYKEDIRVLCGGKDAKEQLQLQQDVTLQGWEPGTYTVYFYIKDEDSDQMILLGNEQDIQSDGYSLGAVVLEKWL